MTALLVATTNQAKLAEYRLLLKPFGVEVRGLADIGALDGEAPEESGTTFVENALIKARFYFERRTMATLADDGGLEVDALCGAPGVHSHRWLDGTPLGQASAPALLDRRLAEEVVRRLVGVEPARRTARLRVAVALILRQGARPREYAAEGTLEGLIAERPLAEVRPGFPYRAVLYLPQRGCYFGELSEAQALALSPRAAALKSLEPQLRQLTGNCILQ
ncbi:MAG: non-canonical purine NTP pyrophosphatase [Deltaproteobacteria bacterium]|jgi:XTP/dITP diphosphohydrolase|nr:non-canonical purine NTP pyrophosphatase [Deltaproteobacteria bacterium]